MKKILLQRELRGDAAGSFRSRALEEAIEVEHLKKFQLKRELRGIQQEAIEGEDLKKL